jgi:phosphoglycerate dehydrogenase-like enzyme
MIRPPEEQKSDAPARRLTATIAVPLEPQLVTLIARSDGNLEVLYEPELLPPPRFPGDHRGAEDFCRSAAGEERWQAMLARAEILFGIPGDTPAGLVAAVRSNPGLGWVQAMAAGAGEQVRAAGLTSVELERVTVTTTAGIHAVPLAEFCLFGLLAFARGLPRLRADQQARRWGHYPVPEVTGRRLVIAGLGQIGVEVARLARAFGMEVIGVTRSGRSESRDVAAVHPTSELPALLESADALVISMPLTAETEGLIDGTTLARLKPGATLVNVGRGGVIDEEALVQALRDGRIAGAALDVFTHEPLPADSPLWELPNVIISPHTAALSVHENARIVERFVTNLELYRRGEPLLSRVDPQLLY